MVRSTSVGIVFVIVILVAVVLGLRSCASGLEQMGSGNNKAADEVSKAVRGVMEAQEAAWNRGDIDGFMDGYERSDAIVFVSGDDVTRGWQTVLERYKKNYDTRDKMGTLDFSELDIKPLSPFYTQATGRYQLTLPDASTPHGRFTLIFRRTGDGWRIVHDHTSSAK